MFASDINFMKRSFFSNFDIRFQFKLGWFANAIYGSGDYPAIMKEQVLNKSLAQGYNRSRLPEFTQQEIEYIKGENKLDCDILTSQKIF